MPKATTAAAPTGADPINPAEPAGNTPEPQAVATPAADVQAAVDAALAARAQTNAQIQVLATSVRLSADETAAIVAQNLSLDKAREAILAVVAKRDQENQPVPHVTVSNNTAVLRQDVAKGLMAKAGLIDSKEGNDFTVMSLVDIARVVLQAGGISINGLSNNAIAVQAMHTTSDFPNILADVANKSLRAGYDGYPRTFLPFTRKVSATDFKNINRVQLGEAPALEKVNEKGEYKYGTLGDGKESYRLETYGKIISLTRKTIIDDDLDALTRIPLSFGDAAADLENTVVWGLIINNAKLSDNKGIFHADHNNLGTAGVPSETTLSEGRKKMRRQKAMNGTRNLNLRADFVLAPASLETTFEKLLSAVMATETADVNVFAKKLELITEPLLDDASEASWYLASTPSRIDTIEYAYLAGEEGVFIETQSGFDVDGVKIKAVLDFGAGVIDYRGLFKNAGQ